MSADTKIEYLSKTWNPVAMRCTRVSPGCDHCWHLSMAARHAGCNQLAEPLRRARAGGTPWLNEQELQAPLRWRKPQRVGVQFMGDLFHSDVQECFIDRVFAVMALCPQHTFLVLTKRPERMRQYLSDSAYRAERVGIDAEHLSGTDRHINDERARWPFPLPNVWMGTSVENQDVADKRIPHLLQTNAAKRWVSVEPMLGPVDLTSVRWSKIAVNPEDFRRVGAPVPYQAWSLNNVLKSRPANDLNQAKIGRAHV